MKRTIIISAALFILLLTAFIMVFSASKKDDITEANSIGTTVRPVIIIDPGHGGIDGGAVGVSGTVEKNLNLQIALKLRRKLSTLGFKVIMTRETDISIHDPDAASVRQKKASDLKNRLSLTKLYPESILISIHQNTINMPSVRGAQVFYSPNNDSSKLLAGHMQDTLNSVMVSGKPRTAVKAGSNLYLFYNAENTAILIECGFLSNTEEEKLLGTEDYQDIITSSICKGIFKYLKDV